MSSGGEHQSPPVGEVSQSYHSSGLGEGKGEGVDYSLQRQHDVYASMMQRSVSVQSGGTDRRSTHSYTGYEQTPLPTHPIGYNSNTPVSSLKGGINPIAASASPPQSTWTPRHLQRVIAW